MKNRGKNFSSNLLISLLCVFLLMAGFSRYIETDSGNILIHDIDVESFDCYLYGARLFRPIQASSMNRRPSILIVPGDSGNRYSGDHIAMEFAGRGFVVLTIENKPHDVSGPVDGEPENPVDSAYTFLTTRFFTDPDRTGLVSLYAGAETVKTAIHYEDFTSRAFVSPKATEMPESSVPASILTAKYETSSESRIAAESVKTLKVFPASHYGMIANSSVIAALLEQFHEDLAIPNDSPFWFSADSQHALLLLIMRTALLFLLIVICVDMGVLITKRHRKRVIWQVLCVTAGILIPFGFFVLTDEFMNNFLISVRMGSPFHYLSPIRNISKYFSPLTFLIFLGGSACLALPVKRGRTYITDFCALTALILSVFGFLPILFGSTSGWEMLSITHLRFIIPLIAVYAGLNSLLVRISAENRLTRAVSVILTGGIFYIIYCNLLDVVLI